ncbi:MAG: enoyl-CoA hydratase-related protein [Thermodesulfobacteriota bacterium]|nr:enoyl-CoA hydratase-related protein [Thermodesulfobacteriota bacterium]
MNDRVVTFKKDGPIGIITLNRVGQHNAITSQMAAQILEIKEEVGYGSDISILVITGEGKDAFCIGTEATEYSLFDSREDFFSRLRTASVICTLSQPTIAAINGNAMGQGLEIALACDIRISSETAYFSMSHINQGEIPWDGGTQLLSRLVGKGKALEMILLGETIHAQEALKIGLVNHLVAPDELMPSVLKIARELGNKGSIALRHGKEAINKGMDMTLEQGLRLEADLYFLLHTTSDRIEGIKAFQEKRPPYFTGK